MAYRNYSVANGFTVDPSGNGDFTTIAAALTASVSGTDIFIRPGTFTENLTLKAGVNLVGFTGDESTPNVTIIGKLTYTVAGTCTVSNIRLQTNSDFFLAVTGSAASVINLDNCFLNCSNNTGISFTSSAAGSGINIRRCLGALVTTGIALYSSSASGAILIIYSTISNPGGSTTANTNSANPVNIQFSAVQNPCTSSGTGGIGCINAQLNSVGTNQTVFTANGSGTHQIFNTNFISGTGSAISIGAGATLSFNSGSIASKNANAIAGTGTLNYGNINFYDTSSTLQNTLTLNLYKSTPANAASGALLASTGNYTSPAYTLTPSVTSITLGGGTALANYAEGTFTPTLEGATTAGTTTYTHQNGYYTRVGNLVTCIGSVAVSAATGTGTATIGALPFTVKNQTNGGTQGSVSVSSTWAWPALTTCIGLQATINSSTAVIRADGSAQFSANLQMTNAACTIKFAVTYQI